MGTYSANRMDRREERRGRGRDKVQLEKDQGGITNEFIADYEPRVSEGVLAIRSKISRTRERKREIKLRITRFESQTSDYYY